MAMLVLLRLFVLVFVLATAVFLMLWLGLVAARRADLTEAWEARAHPGTHARFVERGLAQYRARALPRLAGSIYGLALVSLLVIGYLAA